MKNKLGQILLVDDDHIVNFYNEDLLGRMCIADQIGVVTDGQEALDFILKKGKYVDNTSPTPDQSSGYQYAQNGRF